MILGRGDPAGERRYSDDQPRDENGKFSSGGGGGSSATIDAVTKIGGSALKGAASGALAGAAGGLAGAGVGAGIGAAVFGGAAAANHFLTGDNPVKSFLAGLTDNDLAKVTNELIGARGSDVTTERRSGSTEIRANGRRLEGHAAIFDTEARIGDFVETIRPGAFAGSLATGSDIVALVDHDASRVLARTRSGTLRLSEDSRGLAFSLDLPDTQTARDVLALAERGDLGGMSFGFNVGPGGDDWQGDRRELRAVVLHEISVVSAWPAYRGTTVQARARSSRGSMRITLAQRYLGTV